MEEVDPLLGQNQENGLFVTAKVKRDGFYNQNRFSTFVSLEPCRTCQGQGEIIDKPCAVCSGSGKFKKNKKLKLEIPAGVEDEMTSAAARRRGAI